MLLQILRYEDPLIVCNVLFEDGQSLSSVLEAPTIVVVLRLMLLVVVVGEEEEVSGPSVTLPVLLAAEPVALVLAPLAAAAIEPVALLAAEDIVLEADASVSGEELPVSGEEFAAELLLLFFERELPTPPPTAAPITRIVITAAIIQNVRGARPHMRRRAVGPRS